MKRKIFTLLFGLAALAASAAVVSLQWDYPAAGYSPDLIFVIYSTNNLAAPVTNWPVYTNWSATNAAVTNGANLVYTMPLAAQPTAEFFTCAASNMWGISSVFSNTNNFPEVDPELYAVFGLEIEK